MVGSTGASQTLLADWGYDSDRLRDSLTERGPTYAPCRRTSTSRPSIPRSTVPATGSISFQ